MKGHGFLRMPDALFFCEAKQGRAHIGDLCCNTYCVQKERLITMLRSPLTTDHENSAYRGKYGYPTLKAALVHD